MIKTYIETCKPGEFSPTVGKWAAIKSVDGNVIGQTMGHDTKTGAHIALGQTLKTYHCEVECRPVGAIGKFEMRWFYDVPLFEMSTGAAIDGIHHMTQGAWEINRVRTVTQSEGCMS